MKKLLIIFSITLLAASAGAQTYKGSKTLSIEDKLNQLYCTGLFQTTDGTILDVATSNTARSYQNILDWIDGRIAGLQVYRSGSGTLVPIIRGGIPGIYLDEQPITLNELSLINSTTIAIVKVIKTPFMGGFNGSNGAIAIYTAYEDDEDDDTVVIK